MKDAFPVLVVEDDPVTRTMLTMFLTKAGQAVVAVGNGHEALERMHNAYFPLVITDWMMPEMDGLALCRAIRSQSFPGYVYIILLTSRTEKDDIITGLDAGADDYLTKPFNQGELLARLRAGTRILALEQSLSQAYHEIKRCSVTDPLTKCYNRRYLMEHLPMEITRSKRYRHSLHLVMSDIDHFKRINDTYGHQAGDVVLQGLAQCFMRSIRHEIDWVTRYGGEEFIIVLPETGLEECRQVAERIRHHVSEMEIPVNGCTLKVTASFGIAGFEQGIYNDDVSGEMIIERADRHLYQAKKAGRNMVVGEGCMMNTL